MRHLSALLVLRCCSRILPFLDPWLLLFEAASFYPVRLGFANALRAQTTLACGLRPSNARKSCAIRAATFGISVDTAPSLASVELVNPYLSKFPYFFRVARARVRVYLAHKALQTPVVAAVHRDEVALRTAYRWQLMVHGVSDPPPRRAPSRSTLSGNNPCSCSQTPCSRVPLAIPNPVSVRKSLEAAAAARHRGGVVAPHGLVRSPLIWLVPPRRHPSVLLTSPLFPVRMSPMSVSSSRCATRIPLTESMLAPPTPLRYAGRPCFFTCSRCGSHARGMPCIFLKNGLGASPRFPPFPPLPPRFPPRFPTSPVRSAPRPPVGRWSPSAHRALALARAHTRPFSCPLLSVLDVPDDDDGRLIWDSTGRHESRADADALQV